MKILRNFTIKYGLPLPQYIVYPDPNSKTKSFFLAQVNTNDHFVIQACPTSELVENRAALKLLQLLIRSYDLCYENFYNNICKETRKIKDQSVQTDPRPKLVSSKNACRYCKTQMHTTEEYRRWNVFKTDKSTNFRPPLPLRNSSHLVIYFPLFSKKLLGLNPTICEYPILSNSNPFFFFSHSRNIMKFRDQLPSGVYLMLILFFTSNEKICTSLPVIPVRRLELNRIKKLIPFNT